MAKFNTGNSLGSTDPRDLLDNATIADHYVDDTDSESWPDRFGRARRTWHGIEMDSSRQLSNQEDRFQQFLLSSGYVILPDYVEGPITFTARNQVTAYNGDYYRPKAIVTLPFTTTGKDSASWETDESSFVAVGDAVFRQEIAKGEGELIGLSGGKTLKDFTDNVSDYVGVRKPYFKDWSAGSASGHGDVWRYIDGTYWTGLKGVLPSIPSYANMRRYNILTDPLYVKELIATIAVNDTSDGTNGSYDLLGALLEAITGRTGSIVSSTYFSGIGTMDSVLNAQPLVYRLGMMQRAYDATSDNPKMATLTSTEASTGYPGWVNSFALSNLGDLGITSGSSVKALVFTGKLQDGMLYRHVVTAGGDIYVKTMPSSGSWGSATWTKYYSTRNTTIASDGSLHAASPVVKVVDSVSNSQRGDLITDDFVLAGDCGVANSEANGVTVTKKGVGQYLITGCNGLYPEGWQVKDAYEIQGSSPVALCRAEAQEDGSVLVSVYKRKMVLNSDTMEITQTLGDLIDVPLTSWVDVRVAMPLVEVMTSDASDNTKETEGEV